MSLISISNLQPTGSALFVDDENFMTEISENELASIAGGVDWEVDWCGTTRTIHTFPSKRLGGLDNIVQPAVGNLVIGL